MNRQWTRRVRRFGIAALLPCAVACDPAAPPSTKLTIEIRHVIGDEQVKVGQTYTTRYKQDVTFDHIRYWLTNVTGLRGDKRFVAPASYYLVEQTKDHDRLSVTVRGLPPGRYDALIFHIGVDPPHNASLDKMEGELSPGLDMDWGWDTGYQFFRTGGHFVQGNLAGDFSFHIGTDVLYKELTATLPAPIELLVEQEVKVSIKAEVDRVFAGIQLDTDAEITGGPVDSSAAQVAGNYSRMFRLEDGAGEVPITATSPNVDAAGDDTIPTDATPPSLTQPVVALPAALQCGPVPQRPSADERGCMTPFLLDPASMATYDAGLFTFITPNGEPVHASAPGIVSDVKYIEHSMLTHSDLFQVTVRPNADSAFFMDYGGIKNLKVAEGDSVVAGQILGAAGDYFDASVGLVSFGIRRKQELTQRLCPTAFAAPSLQSTYDAALASSNAAWPSHAQGTLCSAVSLLCVGGGCQAPGEFVAVGGDVDEGRRIYKSSCASCHGENGQGVSAPGLCSSGCACTSCADQSTLAARITKDMPPEGYCDPVCAANVAAFILNALGS